MVEYTIGDRVLEIKGSGIYAPGEWDAAFDAVRNDPAVPDHAFLIIDIRESPIELSTVRLMDRIRNLRDRLGPKIGEACAMVITPKNMLLSHQFQHFSEQMIQLRVGIFTDIAEARRWARQ